MAHHAGPIILVFLEERVTMFKFCYICGNVRSGGVEITTRDQK